MGQRNWFLTNFTGRKLVFNVIFWGGHIGIFALGWYDRVPIS